MRKARNEIPVVIYARRWYPVMQLPVYAQMAGIHTSTLVATGGLDDNGHVRYMPGTYGYALAAKLRAANVNVREMV